MFVNSVNSISKNTNPSFEAFIAPAKGSEEAKVLKSLCKSFPWRQRRAARNRIKKAISNFDVKPDVFFKYDKNSNALKMSSNDEKVKRFLGNFCETNLNKKPNLVYSALHENMNFAKSSLDSEFKLNSLDVISKQFNGVA